MPYIHTRTNVTIPPDREKNVKEKLGKAISLIPGKSETWLMLGLDDQCRLYFRGDASEPVAFVQVKCFGQSSGDAYGKMTQAITEILGEELGIAGDHIYVQYEESQYWGWNGMNL